MWIFIKLLLSKFCRYVLLLWDAIQMKNYSISFGIVVDCSGSYSDGQNWKYTDISCISCHNHCCYFACNYKLCIKIIITYIESLTELVFIFMILIDLSCAVFRSTSHMLCHHFKIMVVISRNFILASHCPHMSLYNY